MLLFDKEKKTYRTKRFIYVGLACILLSNLTVSSLFADGIANRIHLSRKQKLQKKRPLLINSNIRKERRQIHKNTAAKSSAKLSLKKITGKKEIRAHKIVIKIPYDGLSVERRSKYNQYVKEDNSQQGGHIVYPERLIYRFTGHSDNISIRLFKRINKEYRFYGNSYNKILQGGLSSVDMTWILEKHNFDHLNKGQLDMAFLAGTQQPRGSGRFFTFEIVFDCESGGPPPLVEIVNGRCKIQYVYASVGHEIREISVRTR